MTGDVLPIQSAVTSGRQSHLTRLLAGVLFCTVIAVYWPVHNHQFLLLDDTGYLTANPWVQQGLSTNGIIWAFTTGACANYHPVTWLVHMAAWNCFGEDPAGHHLLGVTLHAASSAILLLFLFHSTGSIWRSALVASIFALHPLRVESVAWAAELKDTLSTFFLMLTLLSWTRYLQAPSVWLYWRTVLLYGIALLSKPTSVTFPVLLLLLDVWPFARQQASRELQPVPWRRLWVEKIPFAVLALTCSVATVVAQSKGGAVTDLATISLTSRATNAVIATTLYLRDAIWPTHLSLGYPLGTLLGRPTPWLLATACLAGLIAVTTGATRLARLSAPGVLAGWLWYLVSLLPMVGLVQVGNAARADRYTYLPHVGLLIAAVWLVPAAVCRSLGARIAVLLISFGVVAAVTFQTRAQLSYWKDQLTLSSRAIQLEPENYIARQMHADVLAMRGDYAEALADDEFAVKALGYSADAHLQLAESLTANQRPADAVVQYETALRINPHVLDSFPEVRNQYGQMLANTGHADEAVEQWRETLRTDPKNVDALVRLNELAKTRQLATRPATRNVK